MQELWWERACSRFMRHTVGPNNHCAAFASGLAPTGTTAPTEFEPCRDHCGSEPARDSCTTRCNHCAAFASGLAPAGTPAPTELEPCRNYGGSEPARDSCATRWVRTITVLPSRAGSLPQELRRPQSLSLAGTMVGASLLAKVVREQAATGHVPGLELPADRRRHVARCTVVALAVSNALQVLLVGQVV